jgi:hypothetical protein
VEAGYQRRMRRDQPRPEPIPQLIRGAVAQQQVRAGVALEVAEEGAPASALPPTFEDEAAAAAGGIPINGVYRNNDGDFLVRTV